jgi:hypothetical protein
MPFTKMDSGAWQEMMEFLDPDELPAGMAEKPPSGEFEYQSGSAQFEAAQLGPVSRVLLEALKTAGVTALGVRYDGGYDEGFAYPETLHYGESTRPAAEVLPGLASPDLIQRIRAAASEDSIWGNATQMYAQASDPQAMTYALDELGTELATRLLGDGFGTGEYELYGAFTADLTTGAIVDDPNAVKPPEAE